LLTLKGGKDLRFNNRQGWQSIDYSNTDTTTSVVKLDIKRDTKISLYDPQSGTITINENGAY